MDPVRVRKVYVCGVAGGGCRVSMWGRGETRLDNRYRTKGGHCLSYVVKTRGWRGGWLLTSDSLSIVSRERMHIFIVQTAGFRRITLFSNMQGATNRSVGWRATAIW